MTIVHDLFAQTWDYFHCLLCTMIMTHVFFVTAGGSYHYHHGMAAGDTTLDTLVAGIVTQAITSTTKQKRIDEQKSDISFMDACASPSDNKRDLSASPLVGNFLDLYIKFMTTPDSHSDIYAGTAHRMYFANYVQKKDKFECADNDGHNTDSIDGLTNVIPISLALIASGVPTDEKSSAMIHQIINSTRDSKILPIFGDVFHDLLKMIVADDKDLRQAILDVVEKHSDKLPMHYLTKARLDRYAATKYLEDDPMSACYIQSNFPVLLSMAYKYADDPNKALLAGANAGGENVNRNALLGAIMGAAHGFEKLDDGLVSGLVRHDEFEKDIDEFVSVLAEN